LEFFLSQQKFLSLEAGLIDSEFSNVVFIWFKDYLPHVPWRRVNVNLLDEQSDEEITIE
jgi:hypothetical protein